MEETADPDVPVRIVNLNQVIAWNLAWYRREARMTQKELGDRIGWSNAAVSEAERSFDGKRAREFDAHTLGALSLALGVPMGAFLLPPEDDGTGFTYAFTPPGWTGGPLPMGALLQLIVMGDSGSEDPAAEGYRQRYRAAVTRYLDPDWAREVARWLGEPDDAALRADRAAHFRSQARMLMDAAGEFAEWADAIDPEGAGGE